MKISPVWWRPGRLEVQIYKGYRGLFGGALVWWSAGRRIILWYCAGTGDFLVGVLVWLGWYGGVLQGRSRGRYGLGSAG